MVDAYRLPSKAGEEKSRKALSEYAGTRLRELREAAGLKQSQLAERMGAKTYAEVQALQKRISRLENGAEFGFDTAAEFGAVFGVPLWEFVPEALRPAPAPPPPAEVVELGAISPLGRDLLAVVENAPTPEDGALDAMEILYPYLVRARRGATTSGDE